MFKKIEKPCFRVMALMLLMLFVAPMAFANNDTISDRDIKRNVEDVLNAYDDVDVKVDGANVVLGGEVATEAEKADALAKARATAGVRSVKDEIRVAGVDDHQTVGEYLDDAGITAKVKAEFLTQRGLDSGDISVETNDGVVMLTGAVDNSSQIALAQDTAMKVKGVKSIDNRLSVKK